MRVETRFRIGDQIHYENHLGQKKTGEIKLVSVVYAIVDGKRDRDAVYILKNDREVFENDASGPEGLEYVVETNFDLFEKVQYKPEDSAYFKTGRIDTIHVTVDAKKHTTLYRVDDRDDCDIWFNESQIFKQNSDLR
jgi:hypothetical protein